MTVCRLAFAALLLAALPLGTAARADPISDLIRKKQIEAITSDGARFEAIPDIVANERRRNAERSDTLPLGEVASCHRLARTGRYDEGPQLILPDNYSARLQIDTEATCIASARRRIFQR